jgi:hypothetical protein
MLQRPVEAGPFIGSVESSKALVRRRLSSLYRAGANARFWDSSQSHWSGAIGRIGQLRVQQRTDVEA